MKCVRVVCVHFDFFRNVLLLDEHAATNVMRMPHLLGVFDRNDAQTHDGHDDW